MAPMNNPKYFIYVSDAKIDMLYSQIPRSFLEKFAVELSIDLKPLGAGLGATIKENQLSSETRYSKLRLVTTYVENHFNVGWIDAPEAYIKGSLPMRWGLYPADSPQIVYFGGLTNSTILGLGGSPQYVLGNKGVASTDGLSPSILPALLSTLELQSPISEQLQEHQVSHIVEYTTRNLQGPIQNLEFLAKTLLHIPRGEVGQSQILLGSPLYVALAD